jgi:hypothetical protein
MITDTLKLWGRVITALHARIWLLTLVVEPRVAMRYSSIHMALLGSVRHSCKKLQAPVKACPEIT